MAYSATKNAQGLYDVSLNGQKVTTGTAAVLSSYGIDPGNLSGTDTAPNAFSNPQPDALGNPTGPSGPAYIGNTGVNPASSVLSYGGTSQPSVAGYTPPPATADSTPKPDYYSSIAGTTGGTSTTPTSAGGSAQQEQTPAAPSILDPGNSITALLNNAGQNAGALQALAGQFGIQGYTGTASQNQELAQKYTSYFNSVKGTEAPNQNPRQDIQNGVQTVQTNDPQKAFFDQYATLNPIVKSLYDTAQTILSPQSTQASFTQEYQNVTSQLGIPALQSDLVNVQNVMNGTEDDIRNEITKAGGFATESQVLGMTTTRNKVLLLQANSLSNLLNVQQQYVGQVMQFSQADQAQVNTQVNEKTNLLETMASMQQTMNQNALTNYQKTLTTVGGDYSAFATTVPDNMKPSVENLMGLSPGTLSDPQELQILTNASYKQMQLQIQAQRVGIAAYNAGYPVGGTTGTPVTTPPGSVSPFSTNNPVNQAQAQSQYTVQSGDGLRTIASRFGITSDSGIEAIAKLNGIKDVNQIQAGQQLTIPIPVKENSTGQTGYIDPSVYDPSKYTSLGSTPVIASQTAIDKSYNSAVSEVKTAQASPVGGSPLNKGRLTRNANSALKNYLASPVYTAVSSGATYLARINAAMADPGSISDTSLADSIIKIETGGGQVTEAQLSTYFAGQSFSDKYQVLGDKIVAKGGVLSPQQRSDLAGLAKGVFDNYQQQYENLYVQAITNLKGQGIPLNYAGNLPDFLSLIQTAPATQ